MNQSLSLNAERSLFWSLRSTILARIISGHVATSRLRLAVVATLTCLFWGGMFWIFFEGFRLLDTAISHEATRAQTIQAVYNVFFVSLLAMLAVSSGIILYGALFDSEEVTFLLTCPASAERIVLHKFQETLLFSCWGFVLLGSPLLIAYGVQAGAPWYYYGLLAPFMISFVFIPAGFGSIACLLVVYFLPQVRLQAAVVMCLLLVAGAAGIGWSVVGGSRSDIMTPLWFQDVLGRLRYTEQRLLPSWWLSSGLLEAAHPAGPNDEVSSWRESLCFLSVLVSHALLVPLAVSWIGGKLLRPGYSRLMTIGRAARPTRPSWIDRFAMFLSGPFPTPIRLLLVKDLRLFRRDPLRWTQFLIFFGLLGLYFINVRRFHYGEPLDSWMTVIGFLNLGVVGLIHSTFTTRFIFPMISTEGRRFWILGTLPVERDVILWSKLVFACAVSVVPCATLILLSDLMLGIAERTPLVTVIHQVICWSLCIGLSAIAVGLGARLPNLREPSPAKIAAGFGGTLNLVLSATFIISSVLATAVPCYYWVEMQRQNVGHRVGWLTLGSGSALFAGLGISLALAVLATIVPLRLGFSSFRRLEF